MSQLQHASSEHAHWRHMPPGSEVYERVLEDLRGDSDRSSASSYYSSSSPYCTVAPSRQLYSTTVLAELRAADNEESCDSRALIGSPRQDRFSDNGSEGDALKSRTKISHHGNHTSCQSVSVAIIQNDLGTALRADECSGTQHLPVPCAEQNFSQLGALREQEEVCAFIDDLTYPTNGFTSSNVMGTNSSLLLDKQSNNVSFSRDEDPPDPAIFRKSKSFSKAAHAKSTVASKQQVSAVQISADHGTNTPSDHRDLVSRHVTVCRTSSIHGSEHSLDKDGDSSIHSRVPLSRQARKPKFSGRELPSLPDETCSLPPAEHENAHVDGHGDDCEDGPRGRRRSGNVSRSQEVAGTETLEREEDIRTKSTPTAGSWQVEKSRDVGEKDSGALERSLEPQAVTVRPPQQHNHNHNHVVITSSRKVTPPDPLPAAHTAHTTHTASTVHPRLSRTSSPREKAVRRAEDDDVRDSKTTTTTTNINGGGEREGGERQTLTPSHFRQRSMSDASVHMRRRRLPRSPELAHHVLVEDAHAHVHWADEEKGSPLATSVLLSSLRPRAFSHGSVDMPPKPILKKPVGF